MLKKKIAAKSLYHLCEVEVGKSLHEFILDDKSAPPASAVERSCVL